MLLGISVGLFRVLISPFLGLHCGASTFTWLLVAPLFSFPNSGFSPWSTPLSVLAYSVNFSFKWKEKIEATGQLLPEPLLLPSRAAHGIILSLLASWPRGRVLDPTPHASETSPSLHSALPCVIIFSSLALFFQGLKNMLKFHLPEKVCNFFFNF